MVETVSMGRSVSPLTKEVKQRPEGTNLSGRYVSTKPPSESQFGLRGEQSRPPVGRQLRHLILKVVALRAEVLRLTVHHVAVRAVEFRSVVGRDVRIRGLDALRLFNERVDLVTTRAGRKVGRLGICLVRAVTGFAFDAHFGVTVGTEFGRLHGERHGHGHRESRSDQRTQRFHFSSPFAKRAPPKRGPFTA